MPYAFSISGAVAGVIIFTVAALCNRYTCALLLRGAVASATCDYETLAEAIAGPAMRVSAGTACQAPAAGPLSALHSILARPDPAAPAAGPSLRAPSPRPLPPQWSVEISNVLLLLGTTAGGLIQIGGAAASIVTSQDWTLTWWTDNNGAVVPPPLRRALCVPCVAAIPG